MGENREGRGTWIGTWAGEDETSVVLDCPALPARHLDLGLPGTGLLSLNQQAAPLWHAEDPRAELALGDLGDLGEDWGWSFDDEVLRKVSVWRLFAQMPLNNGLVNHWLIHRDNRVVERYGKAVWMEEGD